MSTPRSCTELGVCQSRTPACPGCRIRFAPGAIQGYRRPESAWSKILRAFAAAAPLAFTIGLVAGWLNGKGWL